MWGVFDISINKAEREKRLMWRLGPGLADLAPGPECEAIYKLQFHLHFLSSLLSPSLHSNRDLPANSEMQSNNNPSLTISSDCPQVEGKER